MNTHKLFIYGILFLSASLFCQNAVVASSNSIEDVNGNIHYNIGQPFYTLIENENGNVLQGVLYSEKTVALSIDEQLPNVKLQLYPIPAKTELNIRFMDNSITDQPYTYKIITLNGKMINHGTLTTSSSKIDTSSLEPSIYLLEINLSGYKKQYFKFIKN